MNASNYIRAVTVAVVCLIGSAALSWGMYVYMDDRRAERSTDMMRSGTDRGLSYIAFITIVEYDSDTRELHTNLYSAALNEIVPSKLIVAPDVVVERSDAIIVNGMFTGSTKVSSAGLTDLEPGSHGFATIKRSEDGTSSISYILIGDPVPHP